MRSDRLILHDTNDYYRSPTVIRPDKRTEAASHFHRAVQPPLNNAIGCSRYTLMCIPSYPPVVFPSALVPEGPMALS